MDTFLTSLFPSFPCTELLANLGSFLRLGVVFVAGSRRGSNGGVAVVCGGPGVVVEAIYRRYGDVGAPGGAEWRHARGRGMEGK